MEELIKLTPDQYNNLFVTSDLHFGHQQEFVWKKRGYSSVEEMNEKQIETINQTVGPTGILLSLGDWCLNTTREKYVELNSKLRVKEVWMIAGNHNNPHSKMYGYLDYTSHKEILTSTPREMYVHENGTTTLVRRFGHYLTFRSGHKTFICFHFPQLIFDGMSQHTMHLCGHSHGDLPYSRPENKEHKILDCGIDIHKKPLSMFEIEEIMKTKGVNSLHHDQRTT